MTSAQIATISRLIRTEVLTYGQVDPAGMVELGNAILNKADSDW